MEMTVPEEMEVGSLAAAVGLRQRRGASGTYREAGRTTRAAKAGCKTGCTQPGQVLERVMGIEPTTYSLGRLHAVEKIAMKSVTFRSHVPLVCRSGMKPAQTANPSAMSSMTRAWVSCGNRCP